MSYQLVLQDGFGYFSLSLTSRGTELRGFGALDKVKECNSWDSTPGLPNAFGTLAPRTLGLSSPIAETSQLLVLAMGVRRLLRKPSLGAATAGLKSKPLAWELGEGHGSESFEECGQTHCLHTSVRGCGLVLFP